MFVQFVDQHRAKLEKVATAVRILGMDAVLKAKSGHVGLPLGGAEMASLLYFAVMNYDTKNDRWFDRDRFVLSAGHGSMLQYACLHLAGFNLSIDDIKAFRQFESKTPGHPEYGHTPGVECTTGPLGQGLANAVGMATAERMLAARLNSSLFTPVDHRTYVIAGDGCLMEGVTAEASSLAGHLKLSKLIVLYDSNNITIDGTIDIAFTENVAKRYESYGWNVLTAHGNDFDSLAKALDEAHILSNKPNGQGAPTLIVCTGIAGKGSPKWEGKPKIHGNPMSADDVKEAKNHLGVENTEPFHVPAEYYEAAKELSELCQKKAQTWTETTNTQLKQWASDSKESVRWKTFVLGEHSNQAFTNTNLSETFTKMASRVASGKALTLLAELDETLVGGSADLAGSNNTTLASSTFISAADFSGRNIHFGVREHGMGAICNGITLHGGLRAYCATFAVFSDYMRPAIRLAALMKIPTLFIFTHDSFAVGEDGPTHQPIEHMASLRAIPDLTVVRPADSLETFAAWEFIWKKRNKPGVLLLTRQDLSYLNDICPLDRTYSRVLLAVENGAYTVKDYHDPSLPLKIILIATGSEVEIALKSALTLEKANTRKMNGEKVNLTCRVVSIPNIAALCVNPCTLNEVIPKHFPIIGIEAGSTMNLAEVCGRNGFIFGLNQFGASAPYGVLAKHFGFNTEDFTSFVLNQLSLILA